MAKTYRFVVDVVVGGDGILHPGEVEDIRFDLRDAVGDESSWSVPVEVSVTTPGLTGVRGADADLWDEGNVEADSCRKMG